MMGALTNEILEDSWESIFDLTHYAIALWRYYIDSGREVSLKDILKEVKRHPDPRYVEELKEIDDIEKKAREKEIIYE